MLKRLLHWLIFFAVILHLYSCIFAGQSFMPGQPF
jgi:cytochrome b561